VCFSVLQCVAVCCSVLQCVAVCCSVLQCVAVCCSVSLGSEESTLISSFNMPVMFCIVLQHACVAACLCCSLLPCLVCCVCCCVLQCVAVSCSVLQCVTVCCSVDIPKAPSAAKVVRDEHLHMCDMTHSYDAFI